jgi:hypothetical protein
MWNIGMAMRPISRSVLEEMILKELRATPGCEGACFVAIKTQKDADAPPNWGISVFDSGASSAYSCRRALARIETRLAGRYTALDDS